MKITKRNIEDAKQVDFLEMLERIGVEYKYESDHVKIICIFHEELEGSMAIYQDNKFYCFGCQESGDIIEFVRKYYSVNFKDAIIALNKFSNE